MNLIFAYGSVDAGMCRELSEIVVEELEHFRQVLDLLERRGIRFTSQQPGGYGRKLNDLVRKGEPRRGDRPPAGGQPDRGPQLRAVRAVARHVPGSRAGRVLRQPVRIRGPAPHHLRADGGPLRRRGRSFAPGSRSWPKPRPRSSRQGDPLPRMHS